jgi:integrase
MQVKLTQRTVKNLVVSNKPYEIVDTELKGFLLRVQPSGIMTYYYTYRNNVGKRQRCNIGRHGALTVTQARDLAQQCAAKAKSGIDPQLEKKQRRLTAQRALANTLGDFMNTRYKPWVEVARKTGKTIVKRATVDFCHWFHFPLNEINHLRVEQWVVEQSKKGKKRSTINRDITRLKAMLSKAVEWELIEQHPLRKWKGMKTDELPKVRYLTYDEEVQLRNALKQREQNNKQRRCNGNKWREIRHYELLPDLSQHTFTDHIIPMVLLSMNTGMRRGELFKLQWHDVDFDKRVLTIIGDNAKSSKTRHIPLNTEAYTVLLDWKQQVHPSSLEELVFIGKNSKPFTDVKKAWDALLKIANIKKFRWHDMRHHFASKLVMHSVDLNTVRELLGHSDLSMTLRYAHLAPEHKAKAVEKLVNQDTFSNAQSDVALANCPS